MKTENQPSGSERNAKIKNVIRVSSGNFLEMYDFIVFGFFAGPIGRTFFPGQNPYASLMLVVSDLWGWVLDAAGGSDRARSVYRPAW